MKEDAPERGVVRGFGGGAGTDGQHLVQGRPLKREFGLVDLVGRQTRPRADGVVVSEFYVEQMQVPIILSLADDHSRVVLR